MCTHVRMCKAEGRGDVRGNEFLTPSSFFLQLSSYTYSGTLEFPKTQVQWHVSLMCLLFLCLLL